MLGSLFLYSEHIEEDHMSAVLSTYNNKVLRDFHCRKRGGPLMMMMGVMMMVVTWQESRAEVSVGPSILGRTSLQLVVHHTNKAYNKCIDSTILFSQLNVYCPKTGYRYTMYMYTPWHYDAGDFDWFSVTWKISVLSKIIPESK